MLNYAKNGLKQFKISKTALLVAVFLLVICMLITPLNSVNAESNTNKSVTVGNGNVGETYQIPTTDHFKIVQQYKEFDLNVDEQIDLSEPVFGWSYINLLNYVNGIIDQNGYDNTLSWFANIYATFKDSAGNEVVKFPIYTLNVNEYVGMLDNVRSLNYIYSLQTSSNSEDINLINNINCYNNNIKSIVFTWGDQTFIAMSTNGETGESSRFDGNVTTTPELFKSLTGEIDFSKISLIYGSGELEPAMNVVTGDRESAFDIGQFTKYIILQNNNYVLKFWDEGTKTTKTISYTGSNFINNATLSIANTESGLTGFNVTMPEIKTENYLYTIEYATGLKKINFTTNIENFLKDLNAYYFNEKILPAYSQNLTYTYVGLGAIAGLGFLVGLLTGGVGWVVGGAVICLGGVGATIVTALKMGGVTTKAVFDTFVGWVTYAVGKVAGGITSVVLNNPILAPIIYVAMAVVIALLIIVGIRFYLKNVKMLDNETEEEKRKLFI